MAIAAIASLCGFKAGEPIYGLGPADDAAFAAFAAMCPGMAIGMIAGAVALACKGQRTSNVLKKTADCSVPTCNRLIVIKDIGAQ